ncbi:MAG: TolC family protein [Candidatus Cloacimonetes bacterium]|nr:TolC family protein [Candidatus Cloacimonadota bacterium]
MKRLTYLVLVFYSLGMLLAQETISLEKAIEMARENNLNLQSSYYQMESARWTFQNAKAQFMPRINFIYTGLILDKGIEFELFEEMPPITMQDKQNHITSLQLEQILFTGGRIYNAQNVSRLQYEMSQNNYQKMLLETESMVTEYYYTILQTLSTYEVLRLHLSLCQELKVNTEILFQNGIGLETDVMQWELRILEIENQRNILWNTLINIEQIWALTLGIEDIYNIPMPEAIPIDEVLQEIRNFSILDNEVKRSQMNDFLNLVQTNNLDLINLSRTQESIHYLRNMSKADFMPTAFLSFSYETSNDTQIDQIRFLRDPTWQIMANVSIPIFHGFRNITNFRANEFQLRSQIKILEEGTRGLDIQARQAWFDFDSSVNNVIQNEKTNDLAERSLNIIRNLYQQGMTTNVALTDAQNSALASNIQFINSIYDYMNSKNRLNNLLGGK